MRKVDKRQAVETIERLYPQGWTLRDIAELLEIHYSNVCRYAQMAGVQMRNRGIVALKSVTSATTPLN